MRKILLLVGASLLLATCGSGGGTAGTGGTTGGGGSGGGTGGGAGAGAAGTGGRGGGTGGMGGGSTDLCPQIGSAICEKACSCREGSACAVSGGGLTLSFDSDSNCRGLFVTLACSPGDMAAYNDAAACLPLVKAATCTGTGTEGAVSFPMEMACQSPP